MSEIARRLGRGIATIKRLCARAKGMPPSHIPQRKPQPGRPRKTTKKADALLKLEVSRVPAMTAGDLKRANPKLLEGVSERTIQHRLQKVLDHPCRSAAKKPLLTKAMAAKRIAFAKKYKDWTPEMWRKVMFSDESTFCCIRSAGVVSGGPAAVTHMTQGTPSAPLNTQIR